MTLIFLMSHQEGGGSGRLSRLIVETLASYGLDLKALFGDYAFVFIRKAAHFTEYFILFQLFFLALWGKKVKAQNGWKRVALTALLLSFLYASSDEFHQTFIPKRTGLFSDVLIDTSGAVFGLLVNWVLHAWRRRKKSSRMANKDD